jgi:hypothetical protein
MRAQALGKIRLWAGGQMDQSPPSALRHREACGNYREWNVELPSGLAGI